MDLLLQIDDVIVHGVHVGVRSQLARVLLLFFLSSEVHGHRRIITTTVAEWTSSRKIASFLQSTATFWHQIQIRQMIHSQGYWATISRKVYQFSIYLPAAPAVRPKFADTMLNF